MREWLRSWVLVAVSFAFVSGTTVHVNFGYFTEASAPLWTYGADSYSWSDPVSGEDFVFTFWPITSGARAVEQLAAGDLDFATLGSAPWSAAASRMLPAKLVYNTKGIDLGEALVCRADIVNPQDLVGKRVAFVSGSTNHFMMSAFLTHTRLSAADFEWLDGLAPPQIRAAWDAGDIDCGFIWNPVLSHLQSTPWCSVPSSGGTFVPPARPCGEAPRGSAGRVLLSSGMASRWGAGVWIGLVVMNDFAAKYPRIVERVIKMHAVMDTKFIASQGFFLESEAQLCMICTALQMTCSAGCFAQVRDDLLLDTFSSLDVQRGPSLLGEAVEGRCALARAAALAAGSAALCTASAASGSAVSTQAAARFSYSLKNLEFIPPLYYFQELVDVSYLRMLGTANESFAMVTADSLVADILSPLQPEADNATNFCQDQPQPIVLRSPGWLRDHDGVGFYREDKSCTWQISESGPIVLRDIRVATEPNRDKVYIFAGLCSPASGDCDTPDCPLLAVFSGGKGRLHNSEVLLPPLLVTGGAVTVVFVPDGIVIQPLAKVVQEGVSLSWESAPIGTCAVPCKNGGQCLDGMCICSGGWAGADCSHAACLGSARVSASAAPGILRSGPGGSPLALGADCRWTVAAGPEEVVVIEFNYLELETQRDPLRIYRGTSWQESDLVAEYSGWHPEVLGAAPMGAACPGPLCPKVFVSDSSVITIRFQSDFMPGSGGFELRYSSAKVVDVQCGSAGVANCSGRGLCTSVGCTCEDGAFGRFCQYRQCSSGDWPTLDSAEGTIRNMAASELSYAPQRHCRWTVAPPASASGVQPGAVVFRVSRFDLEADARSGDFLEVGPYRFDGRSQPCVIDALCASDASCGGADHGSCRSGSCVCRALVSYNTTAAVTFRSDINDVPAGSTHRGFELEYAAVYDCPRDDASGLCLALDKCAEQRSVPGAITCEFCPVGKVYRLEGQTPTCFLCEAGRYQDAVEQVCKVCQAGRYTNHSGATHCSACAPGHACPVGADQMEACGPGAFAGPEAEECLQCPSGTYADGLRHSACKQCGDESPETWATAQLLQTAAGDEYARIMGATSSTVCVCIEGYRLDNLGKCQKCEEGVLCKLNLVEILPGFVGGPADDGSLSVFRCAADRCPGGDFGTCARGRTGLACGRCEDSLVPRSSASGECGPCRATNSAQAVVLLMFVLIVLISMYVAQDRQRRASQSAWLLLFAAALVQISTVMQILSTISAFAVPFPSPLRDVLSLTRVFMFDFDIFQVECLAPMSSAKNYALRCAVMAVCIAILALIHVIYVAAFKDKRYGDQMHVLTNTGGSLFIIFLVQMLTSWVQALQCSQHPNGQWTNTLYQATKCWDSEEHRDMLIAFGVLAPMPVLFVSICFFAVIQFPQKVLANNAKFFERHQFLFGRVKVECYYFAIAPVVRGLVIALATVIPNVPSQVTIMQVAVLVYIGLLTHAKPWRVHSANWLDGMFACIIAFAINVAPFLVKLGAQDVVGLTWLISVTIVGSCAIGLLCAACALAKLLMGFRSKRYSHFLCHHKVDTGSCARLIKLCLQDSKASREVFLDCDNLTSVDFLFHIVAHETEHLVVIASQAIFTRPWCLGEMTAARMGGTTTKVVELIGFVEPGAAFFDGFETQVNIECLVSSGLDASALKDTVKLVCGLPRLTLACTDEASVGNLVQCLTLREKTCEGDRGAEAAASCAILADAADREAVASASVLRRLLRGAAPELATKVVMSDIDIKNLQDLRHCVVLCTGGALRCRAFAQALVLFSVEGRPSPQMGTTSSSAVPGVSNRNPDEVRLLPVIAEEAFRIPSSSDLQLLAQEWQVSMKSTQVAALIDVITGMFKTIAVIFMPQNQSIVVLRAEVTSIAQRLQGSVSKAAASSSGGLVFQSSLSASKAGSLGKIETTKRSEPSEKIESTENHVPMEFQMEDSGAHAQPRHAKLIDAANSATALDTCFHTL